MLKNILSPKTCAECRICCIFDRFDVWETPVITAELKGRIEKMHPSLRFVSKGDSGAYIFNMEDTWDEEKELFFCPALDSSKGCVLGENKPFDCSIWPYRVMDINGSMGITIASICPDMYKKPLDLLVGELEKGLADIIYDYADRNPQIIKPYEAGYPVLMIRKEKTV